LWDEKYYPSVPYLFNLLMDRWKRWIRRARNGLYRAEVLRAEDVAPTRLVRSWAHTSKACKTIRPAGRDSLSMKKAIEGAMKKMDSPQGSSN